MHRFLGRIWNMPGPYVSWPKYPGPATSVILMPGPYVISCAPSNEGPSVGGSLMIRDVETELALQCILRFVHA